MMYSFTRMMRYHVRSQLAAAAFLLASAAAVFGQSAPPTLPDHTVYGRLGTGTGSGPGQAIPFATLSNQLFPAIVRSGRVTQTSTINFYVNGNSGSTAICGPAGVSTCAAGNDTATCLTPATACLTLQHVFFVLYSSIDIAGQVANVYLAHNAGTTNYSAVCSGGSWIGGGVVNVIGDSTNANGSSTVIQDGNLGDGIVVKDLCTLDLAFVSFIDSPSTNAAGHISVGSTGNAGHLDAGNITFGSLALSGAALMTVSQGGSIVLVGPVTITGGATVGFAAVGPGNINLQNNVVTLSGTPAFAQFAYLQDGGQMQATSANFSGSATGKRCTIVGPINLGGGAPDSVFPGNAACAITSLQGVSEAIGVTFATLPSPVAGMYAYITDGKASNCGDSSCTTFGTAVTAGTGALPLFIWYTGAAWHLVGK